MIDPRVDVQSINDYVYGDEWSRLWQTHFSQRPDTDATVRFLAEIASGGDALELGIGSGRVAIPLLRHCRSVHGIDTSPGMLAQLEAKDGAEGIRARLADVTGSDYPDRRFDLIYFISWGMQMLLSEEAKDACLSRVAEHLVEGGRFVMEGMHPEGYPFSSGCLGTLKIDRGSTVLNGELHRAHEQILLNSLIFLVDDEAPRVHTTASHYIATERLDELAAAHGLELEDAYGDWEGSPLTEAHPSMIRVYRKVDSHV